MSDAPEAVAIRALARDEATSRIGELAAVLVDAVASGSAVNFMAGFDMADGTRFWESQMLGIADGSRILLVAEEHGAIIGTTILSLAPQPNARHRAEVNKMLVHSTARRRRLGTRLLAAAEETARRLGRTLLLLDTAAGSAGEHLYRRCGWTPFGVVPDHSFMPDGRLAPTTFFYKRLP